MWKVTEIAGLIASKAVLSDSGFSQPRHGQTFRVFFDWEFADLRFADFKKICMTTLGVLPAL
jgi:hypothetical protein